MVRDDRNIRWMFSSWVPWERRAIPARSLKLWFLKIYKRNVSFRCSALGYGALMGGRDQAIGSAKDNTTKAGLYSKHLRNWFCENWKSGAIHVIISSCNKCNKLCNNIWKYFNHLVLFIYLSRNIYLVIISLFLSSLARKGHSFGFKMIPPYIVISAL